MKAVWSVLVALLVTALAGCAEEPEEPIGPTAEECAAQGMVLGEREVMTHGGSEHGEMDHDDMEHHMEPACVEAGPPATVRIDGLPASVPVYTPVVFDWILETGPKENHAMRTEVRFDTALTAGACDADAELQKPDDWGESVALKEHQNFMSGQTYNATFTPTEAGDYCFRGYALVQQTNVWSDVYMLNVTPAEPTGVTHTVTVSGGGLAVGGLDASDLAITLGDAVAWANEDPAGTFTITSTAGPESFTTTTGGDAIVFLAPGNYSYDAEGQFGTYAGTITVALP